MCVKVFLETVGALVVGVYDRLHRGALLGVSVRNLLIFGDLRLYRRVFADVVLVCVFKYRNTHCEIGLFGFERLYIGKRRRKIDIKRCGFVRKFFLFCGFRRVIGFFRFEFFAERRDDRTSRRKRRFFGVERRRRFGDRRICRLNEGFRVFDIALVDAVFALKAMIFVGLFFYFAEQLLRREFIALRRLKKTVVLLFAVGDRLLGVLQVELGAFERLLGFFNVVAEFFGVVKPELNVGFLLFFH